MHKINFELLWSLPRKLISNETFRKSKLSLFIPHPPFSQHPTLNLTEISSQHIHRSLQNMHRNNICIWEREWAVQQSNIRSLWLNCSILDGVVVVAACRAAADDVSDVVSRFRLQSIIMNRWRTQSSLGWSKVNTTMCVGNTFLTRTLTFLIKWS